MKTKPYLILLVLALLQGCDNNYKPKDYLAVENERSELTLGLSSYASLEEAKKLFHLNQTI